MVPDCPDDEYLRYELRGIVDATCPTELRLAEVHALIAILEQARPRVQAAASSPVRLGLVRTTPDDER